MPITIKSTELKYKNPSTGQYQGIDAVAERTTSEQCALIEAKGAETIASIPSDFTTLANDVSDLNGAITSLENSSASVDWAPSSGDTLLAFLIANITNRNRLPFSFVKRTSNTVSDAPTNLQSVEFTGVVFGSGDRLTVLISKYGSGHDEVYTRNIYQDGFYGDWHAVTSKLLRFSAVALSSGVSNGQIARVPSSGTNAALTEDSFVVGFHFSNPTAVYSGITVTKYSGYFTLTGPTGTNAGTIDIIMGNQ